MGYTENKRKAEDRGLSIACLPRSTDRGYDPAVGSTVWRDILVGI